MIVGSASVIERLIFGVPDPNVRYCERRAAHVVVIRKAKVAMVRSRQKHFLPGGGSMSGETPEKTVVREVHEELARGVRLIRSLGEATQYFYSADDDRHYKMTATFFAGDFIDDVYGSGEHQLDWLSITETDRACFHECHAWAVRQA